MIWHFCEALKDSHIMVYKSVYGLYLKMINSEVSLAEESVPKSVWVFENDL